MPSWERDTIDVPSADVVVVGAGPAGSVCAARLARRGVDVLLVDRATFPRDKACGDGLPPGSVEVIDRAGAGQALRAQGFARIDGIRLGSPDGRTYTLGLRPRRAPFLVAPRRRLDALLRDHALRCGARSANAALTDLARDGDAWRVTLRTGASGRLTVRTRVVVGADGATSRVARTLWGGRVPRSARGVSVRAYLDGIATVPRTVEFHFWRPFLPGYAWIFPLGPRRANVGVMLTADAAWLGPASLESALHAFLARPDVATRLQSDARPERVLAWQLPWAPRRRIRRSGDGLVLCGDAARLVDPLTGEGLHAALVSAEAASDVVADALARARVDADTLAAYDRRIDRRLGPLIRRSWRARRHVAAHAGRLEALFTLAGWAGRAVPALLTRASSDFDVFAAAPTA